MDWRLAVCNGNKPALSAPFFVFAPGLPESVIIHQATTTTPPGGAKTEVVEDYFARLSAVLSQGKPVRSS